MTTVAAVQTQIEAVAMHSHFLALQTTTTAQEEATAPILLLVAMGATVVTIATTPMEEVTVAKEATLLLVSVFTGKPPA